jgi:hypothetical protein
MTIFNLNFDFINYDSDDETSSFFLIKKDEIASEKGYFSDDTEVEKYCPDTNDIKPAKRAKRICQCCNKPLKIIGILRKNGSNNYEDYKERKYHKKCYKKIISEMFK